MPNEVNTWVQTEIEMPYNAAHMNTVSAEKKVYVMGGAPERTLGVTDEVNAYDFVTGEWERKANMPVATNGMSLTHGNGKIHLIGGAYSNNQNRHMIYDIESDTWEDKGTPFSVGANYQYSASIYHEGLVYVAGGSPYNWGGHFDGSPLNVLYAYDPETDTWTQKANMLEASWGSQKLVPYNGCLYHFGMTSQKYDIATDTWSAITPMPELIYYSAITTVGTDVYIMGSDTGSYNYAYKYSLPDDTWEKLPDLPQAFRYCQAETIDDTIYIFTYNVNDRVYSYSPAPGDKLHVLMEKGTTAQLSMHFNLPVNLEYIWSSSDNGIATVDANGVVTAVDVGRCKIYAESTDGSYKDYIPVKVIDGQKKLALHIIEGETEMLWMDDDPSVVSWASENSNIAIVSSEGQVTAVKKGTCYVTGTIGELTQSIFVRVAAA